MMRYILLVAILLAEVTNGSAQLLVGPKAGGHVGKIKYDKESFQDQLNPNLKLGYNLGLGITFPVSQPFSLHTEILIANKGKSVDIPLESLKNTANYYYLEMPIMIRLEILQEKGLFLGLGPNLSYWLGGSGNITNIESTSTPISYRVDLRQDGEGNKLTVPEPNRLQLGLIMGVGALFKVGEDYRFLAELRLEMGHSFFAGPSGGTIENLQFFDNLESRHQLISMNLGYFWAIHKKSAKKRSHTFKAKQRK